MSPQGDQNVTAQIYLTTISGNRVLVLVTPLTAQSDRDAAIQLQMRTAATMKLSK